MKPTRNLPLIIAYGGGLNSTALLAGLRERGIRPDLLLFADTGGELPETYDHVSAMSERTREWWGLEIETVRKLYQGSFEGLEGECIRRKSLPALAFGQKACSVKYKLQPSHKRLKEWMTESDIKRVRQAIGYDAKESHRAIGTTEIDLKKGRTAENWFPLIEWQWRREECAEAIKRHALPLPGKSACYFCPASKRGEILRLKRTHPELYQRALTIEARAELTSPGRGLGGERMRWESVEAEDEAQAKLWDYLDEADPYTIPCGCFDG